MSRAAVIFGCAGTELGPAEAAFFRRAEPWGFILFARNVESPDQLRRLTGELRAAVGRDAPVLIDQEGGRVARLTAPYWLTWKPVRELCAAIDDEDILGSALALRYRLVAQELRASGIDVNCVPVLDIESSRTHPAIGNRTLGRSADEVAARGAAVATGTLAGGVVPVIKHMPGQGRADLDTHHELPVLDTPVEELAQSDFVPFRALSHLPAGMTGHVVYTALDPERCATLSPVVISYIREHLGFDGLLLTDDISMRALSGSLMENSRDALRAGCDVVLHCSGVLGEMEGVMQEISVLEGPGLVRAMRAELARVEAEPVDVPQALARYAGLSGAGGHA